MNRTQRKVEFCKRHSELLKGKDLECRTNNDVNKIATLMREELGYSVKTNDIDIYNSIIRIAHRTLK